MVRPKLVADGGDVFPGQPEEGIEIKVGEATGQLLLRDKAVGIRGHDRLLGVVLGAM